MTPYLSFRRRRRLVALATACAACCAAPGVAPATAQTAAEEAVMTRARPDFDPIGIEIFFDEEQPAPPLTVFPALGLGGGYDSNVFRESEGGRGDFFWEISPALRVSNTGQDLGLEAGISARVRRNLEFESNDFEDYDIYGQANYFFLDSDISLQIGYSRGHEDRSDPDSTGSGENIIQYDRYRALIYSQNRFGDFLVSPSLEYYKYNYLTGPDRDGRDHWQGVATLRLGYEFQPGYVVFLEPGYDLRRYDLAVDSLGLNRDSSGWQALAGLTYNVSAVTFAEAYVGYFQQDYEDAALADAGGLTYGGTLTWNPLDLLTVNASIDRSVQKSTLAGVSGTVSTSYLLGFDYEFTDSLMLTTSGIVTTSSFEGASREDFSYSAGASLVYLVNEFAQARLGSRYEARDSDLETNSYRAMIVEALLTLQY